jgi:ABC-type transporter Mla maintaining outer membrane lipid asymmetry ATPase subunit MlaF
MTIELRNLTFRAGVHAILRGLALPPVTTQNLVLIGPSGSGKSTLLRVLSGLLSPTDGTALIDGKPLPSSEADQLTYRRNNGFSATSPCPSPSPTISPKRKRNNAPSINSIS